MRPRPNGMDAQAQALVEGVGASGPDDCGVGSHGAMMHFARRLGKCHLHHAGRYADAMSTPADRLREARVERGYETAAAAADAMGVSRATYIQHENGTRGYPATRASRYARFFGVSPEWLLYGRGKTAEPMAPIIGRAGADPSGRVLLAHGDPSNDRAPIPPGGTDKAVALRVVGNSMRGLADDGALIYFEDQKTTPTLDMLNQVVVAETEDGEVLVKRLLRGSQSGLYDLESLDGPIRRDVRLRWAALITAIVPPYVAARIIIPGEAA